ncbi:triose-phosphate isomerase family protein [Microbacterium karelineae]|uniref:triose-phosphate isomerase family protein n=1 Tax=Microbacterium karelineae TaxID=2654283 RepID=UPI0012EAE0AF|nr:triose-phosphate isomerase family protein [Microbacterium karelineae]
MADAPTVLGVSLKLYLSVAETAAWARSVAEIARTRPAVTEGRVRLFALPSLPAFPAARDALAGSPVAVGAQDLHGDDRGACTGGVSGADLHEVGCRLVEVGHAERRRVFGEDDGVARRKLAAALRNDLVPVLCVGEPDEVAPDEAARACVSRLDALLDCARPPTPGRELILAYEPEWAIGRADPAPPAHIATVVTALRRRLEQVPWIDSSPVIYGGSAQPGSLTALGGAVDGLFLGRFAHDPDALARMIDEADGIR